MWFDREHRKLTKEEEKLYSQHRCVSCCAKIARIPFAKYPLECCWCNGSRFDLEENEQESLLSEQNSYELRKEELISLQRRSGFYPESVRRESRLRRYFQGDEEEYKEKKRKEEEEKRKEEEKQAQEARKKAREETDAKARQIALDNPRIYSTSPWRQGGWETNPWRVR